MMVSKVMKLLDRHEKNSNRKDPRFGTDLTTIFDITNKHGVWLCSEDKELYHKQLESGGKVGDRTEKLAPHSSVHLSKIILLKFADEAGCRSHNSESCDESDDVADYSSQTSTTTDENSTPSNESSVSFSVCFPYYTVVY
jgi:hypothetical protein